MFLRIHPFAPAYWIVALICRMLVFAFGPDAVLHFAFCAPGRRRPSEPRCDYFRQVFSNSAAPFAFVHKTDRNADTGLADNDGDAVPPP